MHSKKYAITSSTDLVTEAMSEYDPKKETDNTRRTVSGPNATYRLEGTVNGVKKVVYLFLDTHIQLGDQQECSNIFSTNIHKFIFDNFNEAQEAQNGITYDFFLEFDAPETVRSRYGEHKTLEDPQHYIEYLAVQFRNLLRFDPNNRVKTSEIFKNARFHYGDVREFFNVGNRIMHILKHVAQNMNTDGRLNPGYLNQMIDMTHTVMKILMKYMSLIKHAISRHKGVNVKFVAAKHPPKDVKSFFDPVLYEGFVYFLNKVLYKYNDNSIQQKLCDIVLDGYTNVSYFHSRMFKLRKLLKSALYIAKEHAVPEGELSVQYEGMYNDKITQRDIVLDLLKRANRLSNMNTVSRMWFMDVYLLRRLLDKSYVTNSIIYSGAHHSMLYMYKLCKDFGFVVTHSTKHSNDPARLEELNRTLHQDLTFDELDMLVLPTYDNQCSDLTGFPKHFL